MDEKYRIGIKSGLRDEELKNKLFSSLELLELYLKDVDFKDITIIENKIKEIQIVCPNIKIMLHCPVMCDEDGFRYTICLLDDDYYEYTKKMYELCNKNKSIIGFVMHIDYGKAKHDINVFKKNLEIIREDFPGIDNYMYLENIIGHFSKKKNELISLLEEFKIKRVCFDFSHFASSNSKEDFYETCKYLSENHIVYCHISDNNFLSEDPVPKNLNSDGEIDFKKIIEYFNFGIIETYSKNEQNGNEIKKDYFALKQIIDNKIKRV